MHVQVLVGLDTLIPIRDSTKVQRAPDEGEQM